MKVEYLNEAKFSSYKNAADNVERTLSTKSSDKPSSINKFSKIKNWYELSRCFYLIITWICKEMAKILTAEETHDKYKILIDYWADKKDLYKKELAYYFAWCTRNEFDKNSGYYDKDKSAMNILFTWINLFYCNDKSLNSGNYVIPILQNTFMDGTSPTKGVVMLEFAKELQKIAEKSFKRHLTNKFIATMGIAPFQSVKILYLTSFPYNYINSEEIKELIAIRKEVFIRKYNSSDLSLKYNREEYPFLEDELDIHADDIPMLIKYNDVLNNTYRSMLYSMLEKQYVVSINTRHLLNSGNEISDEDKDFLIKLSDTTSSKDFCVNHFRINDAQLDAVPTLYLDSYCSSLVKNMLFIKNLLRGTNSSLNINVYANDFLRDNNKIKYLKQVSAEIQKHKEEIKGIAFSYTAYNSPISDYNRFSSLVKLDGIPGVSRIGMDTESLREHFNNEKAAFNVVFSPSNSSKNDTNISVITSVAKLNDTLNYGDAFHVYDSINKTVARTFYNDIVSILKEELINVVKDAYQEQLRINSFVDNREVLDILNDNLYFLNFTDQLKIKDNQSITAIYYILRDTINLDIVQGFISFDIQFLFKLGVISKEFLKENKNKELQEIIFDDFEIYSPQEIHVNIPLNKLVIYDRDF